MAGLIDGEFKEKLSPFLKEKIGSCTPDIEFLQLQYLRSPLEDAQSTESNKRHYEAEISCAIGMERLYRKCMVIDLTMICAAHCRYCLRANYPIHTLSDQQIIDAAQYCGSDTNLNEVLITGGDPLIIPRKLNFLLNNLEEYAPNIKYARIGSRLPSQQPDRIDESVMSIFTTHSKIRFEIGTQVNHSIELFPEVVQALTSLQDSGVRIYAQNVLLKGVNDDRAALVNLYNDLRDIDIEPHYLFHCIPLKGMHHFRTTVKQGLDLVKDLTCSGDISGRSKPMYAAMTDIGKIIFYEGAILDKRDNMLLLQSNYKYKDRVKWVPGWKLPDTAFIDDNGLLRVWYLDG
jgi:lysine 2,3-aminomutase